MSWNRRGYLAAVWLVIACSVLNGTALWAQKSESETIDWFDNYSEAIAEAKRLKRPIFLEFRCAP